jgi:AmiR/NasT family two-component response regulator
VIHPPDSDGELLVDHLSRIGCMVSCLWPVPDGLPLGTDVLFLSIDDEARPETERLLKSIRRPAPTILAIVSYENPSTLQIVLESGALAVIERPLKPFGILTNLAISLASATEPLKGRAQVQAQGPWRSESREGEGYSHDVQQDERAGGISGDA